jgi:hypothetical protein
MGKSINDTVLDQLLNYIKNNCARMVVCTQEPTTYTEANVTYALADVAMASGDFTVANGDTNGRKVTVAQKSAVDVDTTGVPTHVALLDTANSALLFVTTCSSPGGQELNAANTTTFPAWDIEVSDPS